MSESLDAASLQAMPKTDRLRVLRERMAAVPGRVGACAPSPAASSSADVLAVPGALGELLPDGGLPRGAVVACPAGSVLCAVLAAASTAGSMSAVIGGQRLGLLAAYEQGAALDKIAVVSATGDSAVEVASVLCDLPLIVLDVPKLRVPPRTLEGLRARVRNKNAVLVVAGGEQWLRQPQVRLDAFPVAAEGLAMGHGRVRRMIFEVRVLVRERPFRRGRLVLEGTVEGHTGWRAAAAVGVPSLRPIHSQAG
ncbi:hypothetical protein [Nocardia tengchongensis]|uniref:hypothetical protein n=1 Tax=Nocardia tengchongensis TaxID=2055889 RepID=UPI00369A8914